MNTKKNILWNITGACTPLLIGLLCIPAILSEYGNPGLGILLLIWAIIGYFNLFDLGVGRALTQKLSKLENISDIGKARYLHAGLLLSTVAGIISTVLVASISSRLATSWLNIEMELQVAAMNSFLIAAIGIAPTTITTTIRGALEGLNRFGQSNISKALFGSLMFLLPVISAWIHGPSPAIATMYIVGARFAILALACYQIRSLLFISARPGNIELMEIFNFGSWLTLTTVVGPLMVFGDRFFVSAALGASLLPAYAIPQEGLQRLLLIPSAISGALLYKMSKMPSSGLRKEIDRQQKITSRLMLAICIAAALLSGPFLTTWISAEFSAQSTPIALVLITGIWANSVATIPYTALHASGKTKATAILHTLELPIYTIMVFALTNYFGLIGAAFAWSLRAFIDLILLQVLLRTQVPNQQ